MQLISNTLQNRLQAAYNNRSKQAKTREESLNKAKISGSSSKNPEKPFTNTAFPPHLHQTPSISS